MISVEVDNRSGVDVDESGAVDLAGRVLRAEGVDDGELGIAFVDEEEMRALKREHLAVDEVTDVLSFPIDGREPLPEGMPRALGDVVLCPQVVGDEWRGRSRTACCTCSATTTARRWRHAKRPCSR